jgi:hypothetical protein
LRTTFSEIAIQDIRPTSGGFSNLTLAATIDGQGCIVKAASTPLKRDDVRHEAQVLALLRDLTCRSPRYSHSSRTRSGRLP